LIYAKTQNEKSQACIPLLLVVLEGTAFFCVLNSVTLLLVELMSPPSQKCSPADSGRRRRRLGPPEAQKS
jgi:hypothetical protein